MSYETIIKQAKLLYLAGYSENQKACVERAVITMLTPQEMCRISEMIDINLYELIDDIYNKLQGEENEDNEQE